MERRTARRTERRFALPPAVLLLLASLAAAPAFADGTLAVRNEEDLAFHWVLDPPGLSGAEPNTLGFRMRLLDWFLQESDDWAFTALAPRGTADGRRAFPPAATC